MLVDETPENLYSLLVVNQLFKKHMLFELTLVEDSFTTGIYKTKYASLTLEEFLTKEDAFPKAGTQINKGKFLECIKKYCKLIRMELDVYIKKTKVFELFESLTLGGKIIALPCLDRDFIGEIFYF